jgi:TM2 domain-containing membrane protein YozV
LKKMSTYAYPNPQAIFYQQYNMARRDEVVGILLALFLGDFGVHHFYLRRTGLGILYLCFFWTGIPAILGFIECFFMPGRVREFNAIQAAAIAATLGIPVPGWGQGPVNMAGAIPAVGAMPPAGAVPVAGESTYTPPPMPLALATYPPPAIPAAVAQYATCASCQRANPLGAKFCSGCGQALA